MSGNATVKRADLLRTLAYGGVALVGIFLLMQAAVASWRRGGPAAGVAAPVSGRRRAGRAAGRRDLEHRIAGRPVRACSRWRSAARSCSAGASATRSRLARRPASAAVLAAARERAVPLLQTVLLTAAVLLPAAVAGSRAGLEFLHPLSVTMLGGLVSLLVVQGYVLPALLADHGEPETRSRTTSLPPNPCPADENVRDPKGEPPMSAKNPVLLGLAVAAALLHGRLRQCERPGGGGPGHRQAGRGLIGAASPAVRGGHSPARHRDGPVQMAAGADSGRPGPRTLIPYSAVVYDTDGSTWTYVESAPRTFVRDRITVASIDGPTAVLADGPARRRPGGDGGSAGAAGRRVRHQR